MHAVGLKSSSFFPIPMIGKVSVNKLLKFSILLVGGTFLATTTFLTLKAKVVSAAVVGALWMISLALNRLFQKAHSSKNPNAVQPPAKITQSAAVTTIAQAPAATGISGNSNLICTSPETTQTAAVTITVQAQATTEDEPNDSEDEIRTYEQEQKRANEQWINSIDQTFLELGLAAFKSLQKPDVKSSLWIGPKEQREAFRKEFLPLELPSDNWKPTVNYDPYSVDTVGALIVRGEKIPKKDGTTFTERVKAQGVTLCFDLTSKGEVTPDLEIALELPTPSGGGLKLAKVKNSNVPAYIMDCWSKENLCETAQLAEIVRVANKHLSDYPSAVILIRHSGRASIVLSSILAYRAYLRAGKRFGNQELFDVAKSVRINYLKCNEFGFVSSDQYLLYTQAVNLLIQQDVLTTRV